MKEPEIMTVFTVAVILNLSVASIYMIAHLLTDSTNSLLTATFHVLVAILMALFEINDTLKKERGE